MRAILGQTFWQLVQEMGLILFRIHIWASWLWPQMLGAQGAAGLGVYKDHSEVLGCIQGPLRGTWVYTRRCYHSEVLGCIQGPLRGQWVLGCIQGPLRGQVGATSSTAGGGWGWAEGTAVGLVGCGLKLFWQSRVMQALGRGASSPVLQAGMRAWYGRCRLQLFLVPILLAWRNAAIKAGFRCQSGDHTV